MSWRGVGKIDKIRGLPAGGGAPRPEKDLGGVSLARALPGDLDDEFASAVSEIGEEYARIAQRYRRQGHGGTIPEILAEDWLIRRKIPYIAQYTIPEAHARVDLLIREEIALRIQGEFFHRPGSVHDKNQKYALKLLGLTPVDAFESSIYRDRDRTMSAAVRGREVGRAYGPPTGGQRGTTRRQ